MGNTITVKHLNDCEDCEPCNNVLHQQSFSTEYLRLTIISWLIDWGLTSHQQQWSYGDGTSVYIFPSDGLEKPGIEPATPGLQGE